MCSFTDDFATVNFSGQPKGKMMGNKGKNHPLTLIYGYDSRFLATGTALS